MTAFVKCVVPMTTSPTCCGAIAALSNTFCKACIKPLVTSEEVGTFTTARIVGPSMITASVLVPPTSTPIRYISPASDECLDTTESGRVGFLPNRSGDDTAFERRFGQRTAVGHAKLAKQAAQVEFHGALTQGERARDLLVRVPVNEIREHAVLLPRDTGDCLRMHRGRRQRMKHPQHALCKCGESRVAGPRVRDEQRQ